MDAGMRKLIDYDQVVRTDQGWDDAGIGEITGTEHAGRFGTLEPRQPCFEFGIERMIPGHQPGGAGADTVPFHRVDGGGNHVRMLAEIEVVVTRERQQAAAVALSPDSRSCRDDGDAPKLRLFQAA